jgi:hypothetical protein
MVGTSHGGPGESSLVTRRFRHCQRCGGSKSRHPVRHIEHGQLRACVDVEIADLVLACWQAGIVTTESCQGHQPRAARATGPLVLLSMPITAAERFANALLHTGDVALYGRMFDPTTPDHWPAPGSQEAYGGTSPGLRSAWPFACAIASHPPRSRS